MNKNFSITLMILAVIAVGSTLILRQADAAIPNQNFRIEVLHGDASLIDDIFEISAIRQEGTNDFSRVILTTNEPEITPIRFDARHQLDDRQLENREFYRGTHAWTRRRSNQNETMNHQVLFVDNWPNPRNLNVLNKETGTFATFEEPDTDAHFLNWPTRLFLEQNGQLKLIIVAEGTLHARVYHVDFNRDRLIFDFEIRQEVLGSWFVTDNHLYFYEMGGWVQSPQGWSEFVYNPSEATGGFDRETGVDTLTHSNRPLHILNFETQMLESRPSPVGVSNTWSLTHWGDYIIHDGIVTFDDQGNEGHIDGLALINFETGQRHVFQDSSLDDWFESQQDAGWGGISTHWWGERYVLDHYLVATVRINEFLQFIDIFDLDNMEHIYRGRINIRRDQGLLSDDWGQVNGFEVRLRD